MIRVFFLRFKEKLFTFGNRKVLVLLITSFSGLLFSVLALLAVVAVLSPQTLSKQISKLPFLTLINKDLGQVLQASTTNQIPVLSGEISFNLPSLFNEDVFIDANASVSGTLTAPNILYGIIAGDNITVTPGQTPTISAELAVIAGDGIAITDDTITNDDPGSAQNIFKNVKVGSDTLSAGSNNDTFELAAGSNITLSTDTSNKKITIEASGSSSGIEIAEGGTTVLTTATVIDFLGGDFDVTESPSGEGNIQLAGTLTSVTGVAGAFSVGSSLTVGGDTISDFTGTNSGLEVTGGTLTLLTTCNDNEILKYTDATGWICATDAGGGGGGVTTIQSNESNVGTSVDTLDFSTLFSLSASPANEVNISIATDALNFTELSDALTLDAATTITNGLSGDFTIDLTSTGDFVIADAGTPFFTFTDGGALTQAGSGQVTFTGNVDVSLGLDVTGADFTVGGSAASITTAGVITGSQLNIDSLRVDGNTFSSTANDITIDAAGGNILISDGDVINAGGAGANSFNFFADSTAGSTLGDGDSDLYVQDEFEVDGAVRFDSSTITLGNAAFTNCSVLTTSSNVLTCSSASLSNWDVSTTNGTITPKLTSTLDFLLGGTATNSAKFAVLNVNSGTPVASVSAGSSGGMFISANGSLQTTARQSLTFGGGDTGNIVLSGFGTGILHSTGGVLSSSDVVLGTETSGNYIATITGNSQIAVSGSGSETAGVSLSIEADSIGDTQLAFDTGQHLTTTSSPTFDGLSLTSLTIASDTIDEFVGTGLQLVSGDLQTTLGTDINLASAEVTGILGISNGGSPFEQANGAILQRITTQDFLLGSTATESARFGFLNVAGGTPTASLSAGLAGGLYITANGTLQTTNKQTLTLGSTSTGNIAIGISGFTSCSALETIAGVLTCGTDDTGTNYWQFENGAISPFSETLDLLIGSTATNSAEFAITGIAAGAPTATLSATTNGNGIALTASSATLQSLNNNTLILGGDTTGNILLAPRNGSGDVRINGTTTLNGQTYTWPASQGTNYILQTNGTGTLTWIDAGSLPNSDKWDSTLGAIYPKNASVLDLLIGGTATASSKFAVTGINGNNTPVATIAATPSSGTTTGLSLSGTGVIQGLNMNTLTIGGNTTGNIVIDSGSSLITLSDPTSFASTLTLGGDTIDEFVGTGLQLVSGDLQTTLGTDINLASAEVTGILGISNGGSPFEQANGAILQRITTQDFLLGSTATESARFGFLNVAGGTPVASASAGISGGVFLTATGELQTTARQTLTLGGGDTGNLILDAGSGLITLSDATSLTSTLSVAGTLTANGDLVLGDTITDTITFTGRVAEDSDLLPITATGTNDLGSASLPWDTLYVGTVTQNGATLDATYAPINANFITVTTNGTLTGETGIDALTTAISTTSTLNVDGASTLGAVTLDANANLILSAGTGKIGIGTTNPFTALDVRGNSGTLAVATISGQTSFASLIVDNSGSGDIFTASSSGLTRFVISQTGNLQFTGNTAFLQTLTSSAAEGKTYNLPDFVAASADICLSSGNCAGVGGTGDVLGPGSATDHALVRFNGATGKSIQNSGIIIDDSNNVTGVNSLTVAPASNITGLTLTGTNVTSGTLAYFNALNSSGTIFEITYGSSQTLTGALIGQEIDLNNGQLTATNQDVTGQRITLPTVTNTNAAGTVNLRGLQVNFGSGAGINQNGAGATVFSNLDVQLPALTQTQGTLTANGLAVTLPSSITTGGVANGLLISPTGIGAGTLHGINIATISAAGNGNETAIHVGSGWDTVLRVNGTPVINGQGVTLATGGGTGQATYTTGDILYASATNTLSKLAIGGSEDYVLKVSGGVPVWGTITGDSCTTCVVTDPSSTATNTIAPTGQDTTGLIIRQTSTASPTNDIFAVTSSDGNDVYFRIDEDGNVYPSSSIGNTLTLTPQTDTTALTLVGTNVTTANLQYINANNQQGTIFNMAYGASQTLSTSTPLIAIGVDLSTNVTATNANVTATNLTLPGTTNTHTSGLKELTGVSVQAGGGINQNGVGGTTTFAAFDATIPALTQTQGTLNAYGLNVTTPSSITTGGTAAALNVSASGVGAGTLYGLNISGITAGAGTETALAIGSGWDTVLSLNGTTIIDGSGNLNVANATGILPVANGGSPFEQAAGAIFPRITTQDLLLGGTSSQSARFHVYGSTNAGTTPSASVAASSTFAGFVVDNSGSGDIFTASSSGLNRFVIKQDGNVGIGTNTPARNLEIATPVNSSFMKFNGTGIDDWTIGSEELGFVFYDDTDGGAYRMVLGEGGHVGIGTTTAPDVGTFAKGLEISGTSAALALTATTGKKFIIGSADTPAGLYFRDETSGAYRMVIDTNGKIGINTGVSDVLGTIDVRGNTAHQPIASFSGQTSAATLVLDQRGLGDILAASSSGFDRFVIRNNGNAEFNSGLDANLGTWNVASETLPVELVRHATIFANGYIYVLGGRDGSDFDEEDSVYYTKVNSNGSVGPWITSSNPLPESIEGLSAVSVNGYIYVMGGYNGTTATSTVYSAKINTDGSVGAWRRLSDFTGGGREMHMSFTANGYIYIIGDDTSVLYAKANPDGTTSAWQTTTSIAGGDRHGVVAVNGFVYVIGGGSNDLYYARINADGTLSSFITMDNVLPDTLSSPTAVAANGYLYLLGGYDGDYQDTVHYARVNADGSVGTWMTDPRRLPEGRFEHTSVTANGYIYVLGGSNGLYNTNVWYASTARVSMLANLDLIGMTNASLSSTSGELGMGSLGGSIFAGNIFSNANLEVIGATRLWGPTLINNALTAHSLYLSGYSGTTPSASISAQSSFAGLVVDNSGSGDLFTASSSGQTRFTIKQNGNLTINGVEYSWPTSIGGTYILQSTSNGVLSWIDPGSLPNSDKWDSVAGALFPKITSQDLLLGGTSSSSALFRVTGNSPFAGTTSVASISANTSFAGLVVDNRGSGDLFTASSSGLNRFVINQSGNVGINTPNPEELLDITAKDTGSAFGIFSPDRSQGIYAYWDTSNIGWEGFNQNIVFLSTTYFDDDVQFNNSDLTFVNSINSTGERLGIGTTSPLAFVDIRSNVGLNGGTIPVASISGRTSFASLAVDNSLGDLFTASSSGLSRFVIKQNGQIGIGTSLPTKTVEITGAGEQLLRLNSTDTNDAGIDFFRLGSGGGNGDWRITNSLGLLMFRGSTDDFATFTTHMMMTTNGTVGLGIGQATPNATLDLGGVSGTIPTASISANSSFSGLVVDNRGRGDLFTASSSGLTRFVIAQNGNVGIGTTSAVRALDIVVNNSITNAPPLRIAQQGSGDASMEFLDLSKNSFFAGMDADDSSAFKINSSTAAIGGSTEEVVIFLTSGSTWNVPDNWNSDNNTIEVIGGGGGGADGDSGGGGGGGGGAYASASNVTLTPSNSVNYAVGSGGSVGNDGGDTWFCDSTSNCASLAGNAVVAGAEGGSGASTITGGAGGSTGVGDTTNSGGTGGSTDGISNDGGAGGGGAAGPHGNGGDGGDGDDVAIDFGGGGGGGGANGGANGSNAVNNGGGDGGNNRLDSGGGTNGGGDGSNGGGGGGGEDNGQPGGDGSTDAIWTQTSDSTTAGPGSGAGGGNSRNDSGTPGSYGGGGGGGGGESGLTGNGAAGTQGIIVITYTPKINNTFANALLSMTQTGALTLQNSSDSTTALLLKNASGTNLFTLGTTNTVPVASIGANTSFSGMVIDNSGPGDLFTASSSGLSRFTIRNNGTIQLSTVMYNNCTALETVNGLLTCGTDDSAAGGSTNWTLDTTNGILRPNNSTVDLLIGGISSTSAKFHVYGSANLSGTQPVASVSGNTSQAAFILDNRVGDLFTASSSGLTRFTINQNGNVGIGTALPTEKLHLVSGNFLQTIATGSATQKGFIKDGVGATDLNGAGGIYVSGKYAYVASNVDDSLTIIDISDPASPTEVSVLKDGVGATDLDGASGVHVAGRYAYVVAAIDDSLTIVDISNPSSPTQVGVIKDEVAATDLNGAVKVYVSGKYAYVAVQNDNALTIIDVSNPSSPTQVGVLKDGVGATDIAGAQQVYVSGRYAYVVASNDGALTIVDVSDPASPTEVSVLKDGVGATDLAGATSVYISGKYAYVAAQTDNALTIVDISDPSSPTEVAVLKDGVGATDLAGAAGIYVVGRYAYVAASSTDDSLTIIDVSNPSSPTQVDALKHNAGATQLNGAFGIAVSGKYAYVTGQVDDAMTVVEIPGIDAPSAAIGNIISNNITVTENIDIGNNLYVANGLNVGLGGIYTNGAIAGNQGLSISNTIGTQPIASFSAQTSFAGLIVDNSGPGDLFTASSSGLSRFTILQNGTLQLDTVAYNTCTALETVNGLLTCGTDDGGVGSSNWDVSNGVIRPKMAATLDFLIGGTATNSSTTNFAKFAVLNVNSGTPTASVSAGVAGGAYLTATGTLATTALQGLTIGTGNTGNILIKAGDMSTGSTSKTVSITGGSHSVANRTGGNVNITGGSSTSSSGTGDGGDVIITGGNASGSDLGSVGGNVTINTGLGQGGIAPGTINIGNTSAGAIVFGNTLESTSYTFASLTNCSSIQTSGAGLMSCGSAGGGSNWDTNNGVLTQKITTRDLLIGGTSSSSALFRVTGNSNAKGTTSVASVAANTSFAAMVVDNSGAGDLFTASSAGQTRFTVKQNGAVVIGTETNGIVFDYLNGGTASNFYRGSARPQSKITLSPEYPGAILTASGSAATSGNMTSDASTSASLTLGGTVNNFLTYYEWTTTTSVQQDYTVAVRVTLPADFSSWAPGGSAMQVLFNTELTTTDSNKLDVMIIPDNNNSTPAVYFQNQTSSTAKQWRSLNISANDLNDSPTWNTASQSAMIYLRMYSRDNNHVQIGDIILNYLKKF